MRIVGRRPSSDGRIAPVIAFYVPGRASADIVATLNAQQIAIGNSDFWAARLIKALGLTAEDGVVRIGLAHYNDDRDVERLLTALDRALLGVALLRFRAHSSLHPGLSRVTTPAHFPLPGAGGTSGRGMRSMTVPHRNVASPSLPSPVSGEDMQTRVMVGEVQVCMNTQGLR